MDQRRYTLAATALGSSLAFIDATAVIVALPTIQKAFNLGLSGEQWVFLSYSLALAALYLVGGGLGDRLGRRKVFNWGIAGFASASALAGLSPNGMVLIIARVLQGVAGAFVTTNSLAWLRSVYGEKAGKAVGLWTALTGISTIVAPPLGGILTQWLSWRWIFYINLPLACLVLFWSSRAIEDKATTSMARRIDLQSSVFIAAGFGGLSYYLVQGAKTGFAELWWALAAGVFALVLFFYRQAKTTNPLLPLRLFKLRNFSASNLETLLLYGALNGIFVYLTLYLQFLGLSPLASSLFLIPTSIVLIALAAYFGSLADKYGPRLLLSIGPVLISAGALLFSFINDQDGVWLIGSIAVLVFSIGLAMIVAPITATALKSVPADFSGIASGVNNTVARIGGLVAVAVVGMIISVVFYNRVASPSEVPLDLRQSQPALREASKSGYQAGMWFVSGLALASAIVGYFGIEPVKRPAK